MLFYENCDGKWFDDVATGPVSFLLLRDEILRVAGGGP